MKKVIILSVILMFSVTGSAKKTKQVCPVTGTWNYSNSSAVNDFQEVYKLSGDVFYAEEKLIFGENGEFRHNFLNELGTVIKSLTGNWKFASGKIKISYADVDFELLLDYFFLDKDLVLGQNFSHVIFSRDLTVEPKFAHR